MSKKFVKFLNQVVTTTAAGEKILVMDVYPSQLIEFLEGQVVWVTKGSENRVRFFRAEFGDDYKLEIISGRRPRIKAKVTCLDTGKTQWHTLDRIFEHEKTARAYWGK